MFGDISGARGTGSTCRTGSACYVSTLALSFSTNFSFFSFFSLGTSHILSSEGVTCGINISFLHEIFHTIIICISTKFADYLCVTFNISFVSRLSIFAKCLADDIANVNFFIVFLFFIFICS